MYFLKMLSHKRASRNTGQDIVSDTPDCMGPTPSRHTISLASTAARNQRAALSRFSSFSQSLSQVSSSSLDSINLTASQEPARTPEELDAHDILSIHTEAELWFSLPIVTATSELNNFDLIEYWNVSKLLTLRPELQL